MEKSAQIKPLSSVARSWYDFIQSLSDDQKELFLKLEEICQLSILEKIPFSSDQARHLVKDLEEIDAFFQQQGGILGYQAILEKIQNPPKFNDEVLEAKGIQLAESTSEVWDAVYQALLNLEKLAEVYAIGGAADRLNLVADEKMLPAACLQIAGKTLLEHLLCDLTAKEWLYFKLFNKTLTVPVSMMTSFEKDNQAHIYHILETHDYFQRPKDSITIFHQPLVPMVNENLEWQTSHKGLFLKPGGHGVIWTLCVKEGIFQTLKNKGIKKLSIRQINNPIACIDFGHLAFLGYGFKKDAHFGFFACERFALSQEGINVVLKKPDRPVYALTNIEYCQLKVAGIEDVPDARGYSKFPANTNVLFGDLEVLESLAIHHPLPGPILNYKALSWDGQTSQVARLETTMQNVADYLTEDTCPLEKVYMTLSPRYKTISPTKKQKTALGGWEETPQACFYDFMKNAEDLLKLCRVAHTPLNPLDSYYFYPSFVFVYNPALGPLFSLIAQKIQEGYLAHGAYLNLDIAEAMIHKLHLQGAMRVVAKNPFGLKKGQKRLFSEACSRIKMIDCQVHNRGVDFPNSSHFYQQTPVFMEKFEVVLEGFSEFEAEGIVFAGNMLIHVPDGVKWTVKRDENGKLVHIQTPLKTPSWTYSMEWSEKGPRLLTKAL